LLDEKMTSFLVVVATKMMVKKNRKSRLEVAKTGRDFFWSWSRPIWAKKVGRDFLVRCNQGIQERALSGRAYSFRKSKPELLAS